MIPVRDGSGMILAPAIGMSAYIKDGKLYINGEVLDLPPALNAPDTIQADEQPYVSALLRRILKSWIGKLSLVKSNL